MQYVDRPSAALEQWVDLAGRPEERAEAGFAFAGRPGRYYLVWALRVSFVAVVLVGVIAGAALAMQPSTSISGADEFLFYAVTAFVALVLYVVSDAIPERAERRATEVRRHRPRVLERHRRGGRPSQPRHLRRRGHHAPLSETLASTANRPSIRGRGHRQ